MKRLRLVLIKLIALVIAQAASAQTLIFKNFSVTQGLASTTVYSVFQDSKGFIWFGTESGVNRYNGHSFELFTIDNGLSDNEVLNIKEDSRGRIWFLTLNGKLSYYLNKKIFNSENDPLLRRANCHASFVSFFEDSKGSLWFSTNQNILLEINSSNQTKIYRSATNSLANTYLFENPNKELGLISNEVLLTLRHGKFVRQPLAERPGSVKSILKTKDSSLLYLSKNNLTQLKSGQNIRRQTLPSSLNNIASGKFLIDKQKSLWISTMGSGLFLIKENKPTAENHLKGNIISDIIQDDEENLWISTIGNGVFMLPSYFHNTTYFTTADGLSSNAVHSILKVNNQLICGLRNGSIDIIQNNKISHRTLQSKSAYNPVKRLFYDLETQAVWFASDKSLGKFSLPNYVVSVLKEKNNSSYAVKDFSISKSGEISVALASGVYLLSKFRSPLTFNSKPLGPEEEHFLNRAFAVFYDSQERLWFSNINGLHCFDNGRIVHLYKTMPLLSNRITDISELPNKSIICTTHGFGVFVLKDFKVVKRITRRQGLISNISRKVFVEQKNAWIVTGKGISKIDFLRAGRVSSYSTANGLMSSEVNDIYVDNDTVYAATNSGISILTINKKSQKQIAPKLYINTIHANKTLLKLQREVKISYQLNNITLNYIALDYTNPSAVLYSYRLNPESKWSETSNTNLELAALEPGEYHFQLRAKSLNSNWSDPVEIDFVITPPLWKTWWFVTATFVLLGILFFQLINYYYKVKRAKENEDLLARTKIISLEQQALQAMMNPHFVFNVMNSIQYFINTKDNAMANQVLTGFARLIRKNLENCNKSYITIEEEVTYLSLYLSLEKLRFSDRMNYSIEVDQEIDRGSTLIPSMLLQPFVENAIWHGLMPKETEGNIRITVEKVNDEILKIEIADDGIGIEQSLQHKSTEHISRGMELTNERIKLLNKFTTHPISLEIRQRQPDGTIVSLTIPLQYRLLN